MATSLILLRAGCSVALELGEPASIFGVGLGAVVIAVAYVGAIAPLSP
ncbi:MAG: hypothetical protein AAF322_06630 [Pseudomonadota bacterium]